MVATFIQTKVKKKKRRKMNRQFDLLTMDCKIDILENMAALAMAYESENNTGDSIELLACDYGQVYLLELADFELIEMATVVSWGGPKPPKPPRIV